MPNTFLISDHHFDHSNILTFTRRDGSLLRPGFTDVDHMNEHMIQKWNSVVKPEDKVYYLGDFTMSRKSCSVAGRLNGRKVLILGNHDHCGIKAYSEYFYDIRSCHKLGTLILSHYPIHEESIAPWCLANVHGHLHDHRVTCEDRYFEAITTIPDPKYMPVNVEYLDYEPIELSCLISRIKEQK